MVHISDHEALTEKRPQPASAAPRANIANHVDWLEGVFDAMPAHIAVLDSQGLIVAVNRAWKQYAQTTDSRPRCEGVGINYLEALRTSAERADGNAAHALVGLKAVLSGQKPGFELEYPGHRDSRERWFLIQVSPLPHLEGCVVSHIDITTRKQAELEKARLASILEATTDFVGVADMHGRELYANRAMRQLRGLGLSPHDPLGFIVDYYPEKDYKRIVEEGLPDATRRGVWAGEVAILDASGREIPVHQLIIAHTNEAGKTDYFSTIMRDISESRRRANELQQANEELKRVQDQLLHSEKMASIGQLAAGVAHEINNPIGYLHSNLGTLGQYIQDVFAVLEAYETTLSNDTDPARKAAVDQRKKETDFEFLREDIPKLLAESQEGIRHVRKIVQDLKDFAHTGDHEEWQWLDLRHSLKRTLNIVHNELKYKAEVRQDFGDIPEIRCLPGQLNQVFMNLLINAGQAIEHAGEVRLRVWQEGAWVWVEIADTGCGIPQEIICRIFDPFFTTKPVGKGTGLGLSISYGIVHKHGGRIEVESQVGQGTTFRVGLPVAGPEHVEPGQPHA